MTDIHRCKGRREGNGGGARAVTAALVRLLAAFIAAFVAMPLAAQTDTTGATRIPLWEGGVPGFEDRRDIPEVSDEWWTRNINDPAIWHFAPPEWKRTGTAVLVMPGGGHENLVTTTEGVAVARWFAEQGVDAFVLYYRLFREAGSPWTVENARQDGERAMRTIRARAEASGIDPGRIGVIGFSAGGELARMTMLSPPVAPPGTPDAVDALDARPDFGILVFPGPLHADGETIGPGAPPALLSVAMDDECCADPTIELFLDYRAAGAPVELHAYQEGGHAYNMGEATDLVSLQNWPETITEWMIDRDLLPAPADRPVP
ncbi:alpha/beta hydrolase [Aurantiacibacter spongiae]|uniref:Alpha/beta hydrolase n=1 Tax=Aurantiacibacter spongiae TaxID=2488860 RepID=A0A3N5CPV1_9SPHN|nr:alpha/beta hydrolase [Aurantiacibacter spongiae]RPF70617.1 alpha/beta hydrolase [Aurantiacibacter spongiae]